MTTRRTLGLLAALLILPQAAHSAPPEENLPIAPRPVPRLDDGPADGLTLDDAIHRLLAGNYDLRTKYQDISEARANELTASLRNAPVVFLSGHQLPYGRYSPQRPGTPNYEVAPTQNVDYSGKRQSHMRQAQWATREVEARYQNAVRLEIDRLYDAYVDVLEARETLRSARQELQELTELAALIRKRPSAEADRIAVLRFNAESAANAAEVELVQRKRSLAVLLALPLERVDCLEIRDSLADRAPPPPPIEELVYLAQESRPDVAVQRLGIEHDRATVKVTQAERFDDAIVFFSPYEPVDNSPVHKQTSVGWGTGALVPVTLLNRNQGIIARARIGVAQRQIEAEGMERRAAGEVRRAWTEYTASRQAVEQYEGEGLPAARRIFEERVRQYGEGKDGIDAVLQARKDYRELSRLYLEARVSHRRAMLKLNSAVGKRVLP